MGSPLSLSGIQPRDANNLPIMTPATVQFSDATGTPITSPKTSVGTGGQAFVVPTGAVFFCVYPSAAAYVNLSGTFDASNGYNTIPATVITKIPCGNLSTTGGSIYVAATASTITVGFHFEMLA